MDGGTTNTGEEYIVKQVDGLQVQVALIKEDLSNISETDTISNLTEPSVSEYNRQTTALTVDGSTADWQVTNTTEVEWQVTGTSFIINSYVYLVQFQSDETGDSSLNYHILKPSALKSPVDPSKGIDKITFPAETAAVQIK